MTTIISIKGKNTRMGKLFKTPKHLLLHNGRPAIERTKELMSQFGEVIICDHENTPLDTGIVDMLLQMDLPDQLFVVDCDVIPYRLNEPTGTTVYCFENTDQISGYSNFSITKDGFVDKCNEKEEVLQYAGAGVYYFGNMEWFRTCAKGCSTLAQVMAKMKDKGLIVLDHTSEIFRFGSLQTILNNK